MTIYPDEYHAFKSKYVELINVQKRIARKFCPEATLRLHVLFLNNQVLVGYVPHSVKAGGRHLAVNASNYAEVELSDDGFLLATMSIATSSLWSDIEFGHFEAFRSLQQLYILRDTPEDEKINFTQLKGLLANLHEEITQRCCEEKESDLIAKLLD